MMDALARERAARFEAELIAERAMRDLWDSGRQLQVTVERLQQLTSRLDGEIALRTEALEEANEHLQRLANTMAHDVKAPLSTAHMKTQMALRALDGGDIDAACTALKAVQDITARAHGMVGELLAAAQRPDTAAEVVCLQDLVDEVVAARGVDAAVGTLPDVQGNRLLLHQLFENLVDNAIKYASPGRPLELSIRARGDTITVRDNGIGIEPQDRTRIFETGIRATQASTGHGIGLSTCKWIVERHGGTITADGTPGLGAIFTITLPAALLVPARASAPSA